MPVTSSRRQNLLDDSSSGLLDSVLRVLTSDLHVPLYLQAGLRVIDFQTGRRLPKRRDGRWASCTLVRDDGTEEQRRLTASSLLAHAGVTRSKSGLRRNALGRSIYAAAFPEVGRRVVLDVDAHGSEPAAPRTRAIVEWCRRRGLAPLVCSSPGGGHHVTLVMPRAVRRETGHQVGLDILRAVADESGVPMAGIDVYPHGNKALRLPLGRGQHILDPDTLEVLPSTLEVRVYRGDIDPEDIPAECLSRIIDRGRSRVVEYYRTESVSTELRPSPCGQFTDELQVYDPAGLVASSEIEQRWVPAEDCHPFESVGDHRLGPLAIREYCSRLDGALLPEDVLQMLQGDRSASQTGGRTAERFRRLSVVPESSCREKETNAHEWTADDARDAHPEASTGDPQPPHQTTLYLYQDPLAIPSESIPISSGVPHGGMMSSDEVGRRRVRRVVSRGGQRAGVAYLDPREHWTGVRWRAGIAHLLARGVTVAGTRNAAVMKLAFHWYKERGLSPQQCLNECRRWAGRHAHASSLSGAHLVRACESEMKVAINAIVARNVGHRGRGRFVHDRGPHATSDAPPVSWRTAACGGTTEQLLAGVDERVREEVSALLQWLALPSRSGAVVTLSTKLLKVVCGSRRVAVGRARLSTAVMAKDELVRLGVLVLAHGHSAGRHGAMYQNARYSHEALEERAEVERAARAVRTKHRGPWVVTGYAEVPRRCGVMRSSAG